MPCQSLALVTCTQIMTLSIFIRGWLTVWSNSTTWAFLTETRACDTTRHSSFSAWTCLQTPRWFAFTGDSFVNVGFGWFRHKNWNKFSIQYSSAKGCDWWKYHLNVLVYTRGSGTVLLKCESKMHLRLQAVILGLILMKQTYTVWESSLAIESNPE